jgi:subtilisin family serine protease
MGQGRRAFVWTTVAAVLTAVSLEGAERSAGAQFESPQLVSGARVAESQPGHAGANAVVPGELLVRFEPGLDSSTRSRVRGLAGGTLERRLPVAGLELVRLEPGDSVAAARARFEREDSVLYAEPNVYRWADRTPNDPYFDRLWGLHNTGQAVAGTSGTADADIDAPEAWDVTAGAGVSVAIVDSGLDSAHPDLAPGVWANPDESGGGRESNGIDDDLNGYVDDSRGWDWVDDDADPSDANGHGTHVAGTVGARGDNGVGVAGVTWLGRLMALRVLDEDGGGTVADVIQAYGYAAHEGARVVNASLGSIEFSQAEHDTIKSFPGVLFVAAAGNTSTDNDLVPEYPCGYSLENVLCVAASDQNDGLASFSNYGSASVDLAAPGRRILSTWPGASLAFANGTSMATPHVAGVAALVLALDPTASVATVRSAILGGVDVKPAFVGKTVTGGRLNAQGTLSRMAPSSPPAPQTASQPPPPVPPSGLRSVSDTTPPVLSLRLRSRQKLRSVLRRGVRALVGCSESCKLRGEVLRRRRTRGRARLAAIRRALVIGQSSSDLAAAGQKVLVIRLERRAKRVLRRTRRAVLEVRIAATDLAGNARTVERTIRLRRRK